MLKSIFTFISSLLFIVVFVTTSFSQLTGTKTIPGDYASISAAVTDLNTSGVGAGGVTFNVAAGHTESISAQIAITATGSSANPIVFQKSGAGANPLITRTDAGSNTTTTLGGLGDGVIRLDGTDYITFDGIDLTASNSGVEYGYYFHKPSATDGCQNVTIKNATITMTKGTSAYVVGIYVGNGASSVSSATGVTVSAGSGTNRNITITGNTVKNVFAGIVCRGATAMYDTTITIGQSGGGNTIQNYGASSAATTYGVYFIYVTNPSVSYNTIDNAGGGGSAHGATLYGIFYSTVKGDVVGSNNTFTLANNSTSSATQYIYNGNTVTSETYNNNTFAMGTMSSTGTVYLIYANSATNTKTISGNVTSGTLSRTGASGSVYCYYNFGTPTGGTETITNNNFSNITVSGTTTLYGINSNTSTAQNRVCSNNTIATWTGGSGSIYTIYVLSATTNQVDGNSVSGITASGTTYGIYFSGTNPSVYNNTVYNITTSGTTLYGIYNAGTGTTNCYKNKVYGLTVNNAAPVLYGFYITAGTANYNYNNFVSDLKSPTSTATNGIVGMYISGGTTIGLYYNSIYLNATSSSATTFGTSGVYASTTPTVDMRNNVIADASVPGPTGGYVAAYRRSTTILTSYSTSSNNNAFYVNTGAGVRRYFFSHGTTDADNDSTFSKYKERMSTRDQASFSENPPFINVSTTPYDLHMNTGISTQIESGGTPISTPSITVDYDGDTRNASTPDVGADEFAGTGLDLSAPSISYTPLGNTSSTANRVLSVTISDASGVPTSGAGLPVLYWKINLGSYTAATGSYVSGSTYQFTFGTGVVSPDVVSYYIVAQDNAGTPNVGAYPSGGASGFTTNPPAVSTPPTSPSTYNIIGSISGSFNVGVGQTYTTLTAAVTDLNAKEITGPVTFLLTDADYSTSETFPIGITANGGSSATNTVTIKPASGVTATISGSNTTTLLNFNDADYIVVDGSNTAMKGSDKSLTISNTSTGGTAIRFISGASNNTVKNTILKSVITTTTSGVVLFSTAGTTGNNSNTIQNCTITKGTTFNYHGIYFSGSASPNENTGNTITGCDIVDFSNTAVYLASNAKNTTISQNNIYHLALPRTTSTTIQGVDMHATTVGGTVIERNKIYNLHTNGATPTIRAIYLYNGSATLTNTVKNNFIALDNDTTHHGIIYGIHDGSGTTDLWDLYYNTIYIGGAPTTGTSNTYGYYRGFASPSNFKNNVISNARANAGGTGKHYAIYSTVTTALTSNYNDLYASGSGANSLVGYWNAADRATLTDWKTASSQDANSYSVNPNFIAEASADLHVNATIATFLESRGAVIAGITNDFDGETRNASTPDIGADEFAGTPAFNNEVKVKTVDDPTNGSQKTINVVIAPKATFENAGGNNQTSVTVRFRIWDGTAMEVYSNEQTIATLNSAATSQVTFADFTPTATGTYTASAICALAGDENTGNDSSTITFTVKAPLAGTYQIPGSFATLTAALVDLNSLGSSANVTLELQAGYSSAGETFPITFNQITYTGGGPFTTTVKPAAGATPVISGSSTAIIKLNGADNVIIDGSNTAFKGNDRSLTISNTNTATSTVAIWIASLGDGAGATNNTIKNCNIAAGDNSVTSTIGIYAAGTSISTSGSGSDNDNLTLENNSVTKAYYGIFVRGTSTGNNNGLLITKNSIGSSTQANFVTYRGIDLQYAQAPTISLNEVFNMQVSTSVSVSGIEIGAAIKDAIVKENKIYGLRSTSSSGYGAYGINISATTDTNITIVNNFIYDIVTSNYSTTSTTFNPFGIRITGGANHKVYYNSIYLHGAPSTGTSASMSAAFLVTSSTAAGMDVRNNIFANTMTGLSGTKSYAAYVVTSTVFGTINYNDYYAAGTYGVLGYYGADKTTLTDWRTSSTQDVNSQAVNPNFTSTADLHINTAIVPSLIESKGVDLAGYTTDIDGNARQNPPDIGADEFVGVVQQTNDVATVSLDVPTNNAILRANLKFNPKASFQNTGTDPQMKLAAFNVRFQIMDGTSAIVYEDEKTIPSLAAGATTQVTFDTNGTISGSTLFAAGNYTFRAFTLLVGDGITSNDTMSGAFTTKNPLAGTYTVGATGNYTTLTAAANDLNALGASANIKFEFTLDYVSTGETFPITLNAVSYVGGGPYTVTIKPGTGVGTTISGSSADAIIKLNGADYVTIDGSNSEGGTSRDLTISNTNAAASTAAIWVASLGNNAGATNVTIKNCNVSSGYIAGVSFGIYVAGTTISSTGTGNHNHNLTIENNAISKAYNGIYVRAASGNVTNGILIKKNVIGSSDTLQTIVNRGIDIRFANAPLVTENVVFGLYTRGSINNAGIDMGDEITNGVVSKNKVYGSRSLSTADYGAYGIVLSAPSGNVCNVDVINNIVYDIVSGGDSSSTTYNPMGIRIFGGLNHKIYNNSVYMTGDLTTADMSMAFLVINSTVTGCDVRNNIFANAMTGTTGFKSYAIYAGTSVVFGTIDYNDYYATGPIAMFGYANGADVADLAAWKTYTGQDVHSISAEPGFTSATDLHINVNSPNVESRGTPLAGVTSDFDGDARSESLPDLGADEYAGPAPATFSLLMPANNSYNQGISGTLTWNASAGGVLYDVYLDQNNPPTTLVQGNIYGTSYNYSGLTKGLNYFWKIIAKNNTGTLPSNVSKFSTYTTPQAFALLNPPNNAVAVPNNGNLVWQTSKDILKIAGVSYDVFLDVVYPPQNPVATNLSDTMKAYSGLNASTKYYWKVDAKNDLGTLASAIDSFTVENPVGAFSLTSPADNSINISLAGQIVWTPSANATSYDISIEGPDTFLVNGHTDTIYNYSGLEPSSEYFWTVKAKNSVSNLIAGNAPFSFTTVTPPNPPSNLVISNVTDDSMDLGWTDNSTDETGFYIYRSLTGAEGSYVKIDSVLADVVTYIGSNSRALGINVRYYWRVVAYNGNGESNFAGNNKATLAVTPNETYVDNPNPTSLRVRIASNSNPSNTEFAIRSQFNAQTKYVQNDTTLGDSPVWRTRASWGGIVGVTVKNLTPSTNYTFDTKARNLDLVETAFGTANNATTKPAAPSNLTVDNITTSSMRLNWTDVTPDEVGFYVYRTTNPENGYTLVDSVLAGVQTYTGSLLTVNTRYYWGVTAYNLIGESQMSLVDAYTHANVPLQPLVVDSTFTTVKIAIDANDGNPAGTQYVIRVGAQFVQNDGSLGASEYWNTYAGWGGVAGKVITGLTIQSMYPIDVKAKNATNVETAFGPVRDAHTAPRPSQLLDENFATYTGTAPPPIGWNEGNDKDILDGGTFGSPSSSSWFVDGFGNNGTTGAARFNMYSSADWDWLVSPVIDLTLPGLSSSLYFDVAGTPYSGTTSAQLDAGDTLFVVVSVDSGVTFPRSNVVAAFHAGTPLTAGGQNIKASLAPFVTYNKVRIGFLAKDGSTPSDMNVYVDNVKVIRNFLSDISASSIQEPASGSVKVQNGLFPTKATFTNTGLDPQSNINVSISIVDSATGGNISTSSRTISSLNPGEALQVAFDDGLVSNPGTYRAIAIAEHTNDEFRGNDTTKIIFKVVGETRTNLVADNGGYIFSSSASSITPRPTYGWVEIGPNGGGTKIAMAQDDDAMSSTIYMPRAFSFYGVQYQALRVNTNGFITFDTTYATGAIYESQIPNSAAPNYIVAAFWDDLDSKAALGVAGSGVYYKSVNNKFYVEWYKCQQYGSSGNGDTMSFQIVLDFADNSIAINYASPADGNFLVAANDCAVGIESDGGSGNGTSYYYTNNPALNFPTSGSSIKFGTTVNHLNHTGSISGVKYLDADGDGVKDAGENGIADWQINVSGGASASLNTDANGYYEFVNLLPGSYTVTETPVVGWVQTEPVGGTYDVTLGGSQAVAGKNFGNYKLISEIHGAKWNDLNGNGLKENGEPGLVNWEIHLNSSGVASKATVISSMKVSKKSAFSIDGIRTTTNAEQSPSIVSALGKLNGNNQVHTEMVAFTDANGDYAFIDLPLGNYLISEVPQSGWIQTFPAAPGIWEVAIDTFGRVQNDINFGNFSEATISGVKYLDTDADGQRDAGEVGLENWQIVLEKDGDVVNAMLTGADGSYIFSELGPGTYVVSEVQQNGWVQTEPVSTTYSISVSSGVVAANKNFGNYHTGSISGVKYEDMNANGTRDNGEPGLENWEINLDNGSIVVLAHTNNNGEYTFASLVPGTYTVTEVSGAPYYQSEPQSGSYVVVHDGDGTDDDFIGNFGNYRLGSISGVNFLDANGDGIKDAGEVGLEGWEITLEQNSAVVKTDTTDADGNYSFVSLVPGDYIISELLPLGYIQTYPQSGDYSVSLESGEAMSGKDFGNRETTPGEFVGRVDSLWSNPLNWGYGTLPGADDDIIIPFGVRVVMDDLGGSDSVKSLTSKGVLRISSNVTLKIAGAVTGTGSVSVDADATPTLVVYGSWNPSVFSRGKSTIAFAGTTEKLIIGASGVATFYNINVGGSNTTLDGNMNVENALTLDGNLTVELGDTIRINNEQLGALSGTGSVSNGTIIRMIAAGESGNYRWHTANSYIAFSTGKGNANPSSLKITRVPVDTMPDGINQAFKGGTVNTTANTVTLSGVSNFSRWAFGQVGHKEGEVGPVYEIEEDATGKDGASFSATLSLEYDESTLGGIAEESLGFFKSANTIVVQKVVDADNNFNTSNDRTAKTWGLTVGSQTANDTMLTVEDVGLGTFSVSEADSGSMWIRMGIVVNGVGTAGTDSATNVTFTGEEGQLTTVVFVNSRLDTTKFRTFKESTSLSAKVVKLKYAKSKTGVVTITGVPNEVTVVTNVFTRVIGKSGTTFLGIPQTSKDSAKKYGWLFFKSASALGKFYTEAHTQQSFPIDSLRITGKKSKKLAKAISPTRKTYNNHAWSEGVLLHLNVFASDSGITPKGFGDLVIDTVGTLAGTSVKGMSVRDLVKLYDTCMTYWQSKGIDSSSDYTLLAQFVDNIITPLNSRFYQAMTAVNVDYVLDTAKMPSPTKNLYAVNLLGYKTATEAGGIVKNTGAKSNVQFVPVTGYIEPMADKFLLNQNYPNPFNPSTEINFSLLEDAIVSLKIYDVLGREVATLLRNEYLVAGDESVTFDAANIPSGVYFYRIHIQSLDSGTEYVQTKKMMLMK